MRSFVVVARKPSRDIPGHVIKLLRRSDLPELAFVPEDHLFWSSESGNVVFGGWSGLQQVKDMGVPWHVGASGLTAFTGHLWPKGGMWAEGESWAQQLQKHWLQRPVKSSVQDLDGIYTALSLSTVWRRNVDDGSRCRSGCSIEPKPLTSWCIRRELRSLLVWLRLRIRIPNATRSASAGWCSSTASSTSGRASSAPQFFRRAHPSTSTRTGVRVCTSRARHRGPRTSLPGCPTTTLSDSFTTTSCEACSHSVCCGPVASNADLTGGKDSRLILALLVACGNHGQVQVPDDRSAHTPPMQSSARPSRPSSRSTTTRSIAVRWILR